MEKQGIHQWDEIYPDKAILEEDIAKNQMYIGKIDNEIAVCFVLSEECDEEYKNGKWQYPDAKFNVIHRLCVNPKFQNKGIATQTMIYIVCVNPKFQNKGIATQTMIYIEKTSKAQGYEVIRLDCFTKNPYSQKLYEKAGYSVVGYADWRKGRFELREKKL